MRKALKINHSVFVISHCTTNLIYFTSFVGIDIVLYASVESRMCNRTASVSPTIFILNFVSKYFIYTFRRARFSLNFN